MIKLLRNTWFQNEVISSESGPIKWSFIKHLHDIQQIAGLRAANKLTDKHLNYHQQKMRVYLATQVSKPMIFCMFLFRNLVKFRNSFSSHWFN